MRTIISLLGACAVYCAGTGISSESRRDMNGPLVIAHRGASGYLPEHTLEAYALAYGLGADFIETDLVLTKDRHFIALHDIHLDDTTDVKTRFPGRCRDDGHWYAADFTLEEVRLLQVHERLGKRFPAGKSSFSIPTFPEVIELVQGLNQTMGKDIGIYPELKQPAWHAQEGLPMEADFLRILADHGYRGPGARIFVQCFEAESLKKLRTDLGCTLPMIQLISDGEKHAPLATEAGLQQIAAYAQGIGPAKTRVLDNPALVRRAHAQGLLVHPYTLRDDDVPRRYANVEAEMEALFVQIGVDGLFADFPDTCARFLKARGLR